MKDIYRIAGINILIESLYPEVHEYCRDYLADDAHPDFSVSTFQLKAICILERSEHNHISRISPAVPAGVQAREENIHQQAAFLREAQVRS